MGMTSNERYHARLESLGIPHQHNRRNPLHPMRFVSRDLERIVNFAQLDLRTDKPLKMLLAYWRLYRQAVAAFEAAENPTALQESNFNYYVTSRHGLTLLFLINRIGGVQATIHLLNNTALYDDVDPALIQDIELVRLVYTREA